MEEQKPPIRILIADDHPVVRRGLRLVIEEDPQFMVVAEAADGQTAILETERTLPDVALLDLDMPKMDGLAVLGEIRARGLAVDVLFLTVHEGEDLFHKALDLGAKAYLLKQSALVEIASAIRTVHAGGHYVTPEMATQLLRRRNRQQTLARQRPGLADLTPVERRILQMVAANRSSKEMAAVLGLNFRTVENRRTTICEKLNLRGTNALMKFVLEHRSEVDNV
jgi:DNA-binding NarL/FixJ family response regulator